MEWSESLSQLVSLDKAGNIKGLATLLASLPDDPPDEMEPHLNYWRGKCAVVAERFSDAVPFLSNVVIKQPRRAHAHYLLGVCLVRGGHWLDARTILEKALTLKPLHDATARELVTVYMHLADYDNCVVRIAPLTKKKSPDPALISAYWRSRIMAESDHISAAFLVREALQQDLKLSSTLLKEWLRIAGGLLVNRQFKSARTWFCCLQYQTFSIESCSNSFPGRFALVGRLIVELIDFDDSISLDELISQLRSVAWLPFTSSEMDAWHSWLRDSLWILWGDYQQRKSSLPSKLRLALVQFVESLRDFLSFEILDDIIISNFNDLSETDFVVSRSVQSFFTNKPEQLGRHLENCHDIHALNTNLQSLFEHAGHIVIEKNRELIEFQLDRFSSMLFDHTNRLLIHPDPKLLQLGLRTRETGLACLKHCNQYLLSLTSPCARHVRPLRRWLLISTQDLPQCFLYRVQQKQDQLLSMGFECRILEREQLDDWGWSEQLLWADALMVCRLPGFNSVFRVIDSCRHAGIPTYYDIDDLIIDPQNSPPEFDTYGGTLSEEQHRRFVLDVPLFASAMQACDEVIVSTPTLGKRWKELLRIKGLTQPIHILPNLAPPALRRRQQSPLQMDFEDPVRMVFASGTTAHKQVWSKELAPALAVILDRYPKVRLDLIGHLQLPLILQPFANQIRCMPYTDYDQYIERLSLANIGLVVLEPGTFTDSKSAIRWMEFSYLGLASILSPTQTYCDDLIDGCHALFARGAVQWLDCIERLIQQPKLRFDLSTQAQKLALQLFDPKRGEEFWKVLNDATKISIKRTKKKKILILNVFFAPQSVGGATRIAQDHAHSIATHLGDHYDVTVLCVDPSFWQKTIAEQQIPLQVHAWHGVRVVRLSLPGKPWSWHHDGSVERFCRDWFRRERFDLIHAHSVQVLSAAPLKVARELDIPYCITLHDAWWLSPSQFLTTSAGKSVDPSDPHGHHDVLRIHLSNDQLDADKERRKDLFEIINSAKKRLAVSEAFAQVHRDAGLKNIDVMENHWQPMNGLQDQHLADPNQIRLCFVGGMALHKGFAVLQAACFSLKHSDTIDKLRLTVIDSSLRSDENYECTWGVIPVSFVPKISMDSMADFYATQDVLLAPSIWPESYGLVTREALSACLWVIASDIGALADPIVHGVNGYRVQPGNAQELASYIERTASESPTPRQSIRIVDNSPPLHLQLFELYNEVLASD